MNPTYCEIVPDFRFACKPEREHCIALTVALSLAGDVIERRCGLLRYMSWLIALSRAYDGLAPTSASKPSPRLMHDVVRDPERSARHEANAAWGG
jgi:hypothetical protein